MRNSRVFAGLVCLGVISTSLIPTATCGQGLSSLFAPLCVRESCGSFTAPTGFPVTVEHYMPRANGCSPAVVILYGSDGMERYGEHYREAAMGLAAEGYAAFIVHYFDAAPHSSRPGPDDRNLPDPKAFAPWLAATVASVGYVKNVPGVDPNRVGIVGFSLGGYLATSAAVHHRGIKTVVELSAGLPDRFYGKVGRMPATLVVHGALDDTIPVSEAYKLHAALASRNKCHEMMILPCEGHLPYQCCKEAVAKRVLCFLDSKL